MDPALIAAGATPTLANTVDARFIGRLTPGSDRFNGAFQAGQGINDQLQDGNAFRVSPRIGAVYDLTGKGETIVRGGFGIFYDRPQGNMVFDMIANAPGVLNSTLTWGQLQSLTAAGGDPDPTLGISPTAFDFKPPRVTQWNVGIQHKVWKEVIVDRRVCRIEVDRPPAPGADQFAALRRDLPAAEPGSDAVRELAAPGRRRCPNDLLRPYQGYNAIRLWDYSGYGNYNGLQTSVTRRFDNGFMFSGFWVWSKALGINDDDFSAGVPNQTKDETKHLDYSLLNYDRTHNIVLNAIYQLKSYTDSKVLGLAIERLAGLGRVPMVRAAGRMRSASRYRGSTRRTSLARTTRTRASSRRAIREKVIATTRTRC